MLRLRAAGAACRRPLARRVVRLSSAGAVPEEGQELTWRRRFEAEDVAAFAAVTGDDNAIHREASEAFGAPIVHGALLASMFPALFARHFPGAVYRGQTLEFRSAVPVRSEVTARVSVRRVTSSRSRGAFVDCDTTVVSAEDTVAVEGAARLWLPPRRRGGGAAGG